MGKLKFEKAFSEKLKSREIKPKAESWEQLSKRLESSEETKKGLGFWWIGIAATVIGAIFIFGSYLNEPLSNSPGIVDVPVEKSEEVEENIQKKSSEEIKREEIVLEEKVDEVETVITKPKNVSGEEKSIIGNTKSAVAEIDNSIQVQDPILKEPEVKVAEVPGISQSIEDAIAEVVQQENSGNITEAEVDALLAKAAMEISQAENEKFSSENLDAKSLLREVEFEMEESFREKVFEVLKEGYLKARTAVANRNY